MQDKMEATINSRQEEMKVDFKALTRWRAVTENVGPPVSENLSGKGGGRDRDCPGKNGRWD
jgi:hypothetical protein